MARMRQRSWVGLGLIVSLLAACTDSPVVADAAVAPFDSGSAPDVSPGDIDAQPCQPEVNAADCARCGGYPVREVPGGTVGYCPDGNPLACIPNCPPAACSEACYLHACFDCSLEGRWEQTVLDCVCHTEDAGPR
jgi:hypothetical protein